MPALSVTVNGVTYTANSNLSQQFPAATVGKTLLVDDAGDWVLSPTYHYDLSWLTYSDDLGAVINSILAAAYLTRVASGSGTTTETYNNAGYGLTIQLPPGRLRCDTTINLDQATVGSHITIKGAGGFIATTIDFDRDITNGIGIDASGGREFTLSDVRLLEETGQATKNLILLYLGGSTCRAMNVWSSNSKVGFMLSGAGGMLHNCVSEECTFANLFMQSHYFSSTHGITPAINNTYNWRIDNYHSFNGKINMMTYKQIVCAISSGTPAAGETATSTSEAVAFDIIDVYDNGGGSWTVLTERFPAQDVATSDSITFSGGATGTVSSHSGYRLRNCSLNHTLMNASTGTPPDYPGLVVSGSDGCTVSGLTSRRTFGISLTGNTRLKVLNVTETDEAAGLVAVDNTGSLAFYDSPTAHSNTGASTLVETDVRQNTQAP